MRLWNCCCIIKSVCTSYVYEENYCCQSIGNSWSSRLVASSMYCLQRLLSKYEVLYPCYFTYFECCITEYCVWFFIYIVLIDKQIIQQSTLLSCFTFMAPSRSDASVKHFFLYLFFWLFVNTDRTGVLCAFFTWMLLCLSLFVYGQL